MNFKKICLALMATVLISCEENTIEVFDHAGQYKIEKPIIDNYLDTHYYDAIDNEIKEIDADQTALNDDENLQTLTDTVNEVAYEMYSYVYEQGTEENPDADDILNIYYKAISLDGTVYDESDLNDSFLRLTSVIIGWGTGLEVFKGGVANEDDPTIPREYTGTGKGFMIIPSGLAYQNFGSGLIGPNESLVFKVELRTVISSGEDLNAEEEE